MKILVLTSRLPYPIEKGDKLRVYHQMRELSRRHDLILCSLVEEVPNPSSIDHLLGICREVHSFRLHKPGIFWHSLKGLMRGLPLQVAYFYRPTIHEEIRRIAARVGPDLVFCQLIRMSEYAKDLKPLLWLDYMDCFSAGMKRQAEESPLWQKPLYEREARLLARYQKEIYTFFDGHSIISAQDKKLLDPAGNLYISLLPNGIDTEYFRPREGSQKEFDLCFVGNMGYFPNVRAVTYMVRRVMPLLWKKAPGLRLLIAGARPNAEVRRLAQDKRIEVSGWIEDIREAYAKGKVFVAPLFTGSGQQNKILEAMSMEMPCITTPLVNNAIGAEENREILLAGTEKEFEKKILDLLDREEFRKKIGREARNFVKSRYTWAGSVREIEKIEPTSEDENS